MDVAGILLVEPLDVAQDESCHPLGLCLGIDQSQNEVPQATEHQPPVDAEALANALDVSDEVLRVILAQLRMCSGVYAAALVEQNDPVMLRIKEPSVKCLAAPDPPCKSTTEIPSRWPHSSLHRMCSPDTPIVYKLYGSIS